MSRSDQRLTFSHGMALQQGRWTCPNKHIFWTISRCLKSSKHDTLPLPYSENMRLWMSAWSTVRAFDFLGARMDPLNHSYTHQWDSMGQNPNPFCTLSILKLQNKIILDPQIQIRNANGKKVIPMIPKSLIIPGGHRLVGPWQSNNGCLVPICPYRAFIQKTRRKASWSLFWTFYRSTFWLFIFGMCFFV